MILITSIYFENILKEFREYTANKDRTMDQKINFLVERNLHTATLQITDITTLEYFNLVSTLSEICPPTALSFAMHLYTAWGLQFVWNNKQRMFFNNEILCKNSLFSSLNEPGLFFIHPQNIQAEDFAIKVSKNEKGYIVNGVKKFVSLEPWVKYLPVYGLCNDCEKSKLVVLIIDKEMNGVSILDEWDSISMSQTNSNSVCFDNVFVPYEFVLIDQENSISATELLGYLFKLSIASVYIGIAKKALDYSIEKAKIKKVPHTGKKSAVFPGVQFSISEMIMKYETCNSQILKYCELLDNLISSGVKRNISSISLITKLYVTKSAEEIVNLAMKVEGITSLSEKSPLSSLYKDVKAGQFHPPHPDIIHEIIAKEALGIITLRNRWL